MYACAELAKTMHPVERGQACLPSATQRDTTPLPKSPLPALPPGPLHQHAPSLTFLPNSFMMLWCHDVQEAQADQVTDAQSDRMLQLRIENARLCRGEAALKAKGNSLQEALTALEARMSEFEAEALGQHAALEQSKQQVIDHTSLAILTNQEIQQPK